jgi:predicted DNA-binding protein
MLRTKVRLTAEQSTRLKDLAARRGASVSQLIREGIDAMPAQSGERPPDEMYQRAARAAGRFRSGKHDMASRHDRLLAEEFLGSCCVPRRRGLKKASDFLRG